ncbi:hypothetical protein CBR_g25741 [Chara braunii]|uniref:Reverse transcriptase domain-containing protein n=1 Tax=Chara braunii TaxID=69332 RepID=A0A388L678_CHABU|nr:hypothetical protein CBR_g25741 [Chara braunii]|eukprot:GBG77810.1 hypothetical protein CBR_g25741 [Chara braunii]
MSTEQDTGALPRRSARLAVRSRSVVPPRSKYQQQRLSRPTTPAASSTATAVPVTTGALPACPVQGASEPLSAYLQWVQAFTDAVATAKAQQEAPEAERQRLANEVAAQTQRTAEADAAARDRRNAASTESLIQSENQWTTLLQGMIFVPTDAQADPTPAEAERSNLANLMLSVMRGVMWNNKLLQAHLLTERQHRQKQQQDTAALAAAVRAAAIQQQQQHQLLTSGLARINSIEAQASAAPGCTIDTTKQLNERIDHVVSLIGELGDFTSPATISSTVAAIKTDIAKLQSQPAAAAKVYKMPRFNIGKFEDYNKTDTSTWWQAFLTEASCHKVPAEDMMKALYLQLIGGAQAWMNHLAVNKKTTIAELHKHITWEDFEQLWFTRFMVRNIVKAAMNEVYTCSQGSMPTRAWTITWQKIVTTPGFDLSFTNQRSEFFSRSCAGLRIALGNEYDYASFQAILDRANLVIQTDNKAASEKQSQPHYVAKQGYQRPTHNNVVIHDESVDLHAAEASSGDGGVLASLPPKRPKRVRKNKATDAMTSTGTGQEPWTAYKITKEVYDLRQRYGYCLWCNGVTHLTAQCPEKGKARLVPPLDQPSHVHLDCVCEACTPSASDPVSSPLISEDSTAWSRLEELDPLTKEDFAWMLLPSTGTLPRPHCNALMANLRSYLHATVPALLTDDGVAVVDLRSYLTKIDREYATQRYAETDAPLLYIRIQIGEATCSALIDCGASRNFMSQAFMARAGLGPRVRRKTQPTQVTLADGRMQKSFDRCVDGVPVYFAPLACEPVSFDILDTKFDMILGMSWLRSADHPVNFHGRTVHIRDGNGVLVPCTATTPHTSIACHVVAVARIRDAIAHNDVEEMGLVFLHALPSSDGPAPSPPDPHISHLLDEYRDVFEAPTGTVPDRPIHHGITLEAGAIPPRGCIYRLSEEELEVLRAQLDDLLDKGWIRRSCSPYGAPVLFVRKKNKDLRLCIDYRKLNAQTVKNADPLPRIDDLLERLGGTTYFSKLDLKSGYHQIEIQPQDRYKTAFKTRYGHFEWVVMPFGLTNALATFQAAMTTEFRDLLDRSVLIYLDDILVYSRTLDEHIVHLRAVLDRLRVANYKANLDKCEFAKQELEYLGHYVTPKGIRPLAVQAIVHWPEPRCTTNVRSFMGLAGYYQRFVESYSKLATPLSRLQSPKVPFEFDDAARGAFTTLKAAMQAAPALRIYDPTLPTQVTMDASGYGIGAVLEQCHEDGWHPVEYFSQKVPLVNTLDDARKKKLLALLDLGFEKTILEITSLIKQQQTGGEDNAHSACMPRQNVLLSATLNQQLERLAAVSLQEDAIAIGFDGKLQTAVIGEITKAFGKGANTTTGNFVLHSKPDMVKEKIAASRDEPEAVKTQAVERGMVDVQSGNGLTAAAGPQKGRQGEDTGIYHIPKELKQMYIEVPARLRLVALLAFLRHMTLQEERCKMVVFFSTCSSVEYHYTLIHSFRLLPQGVERREKDAEEKPQEEEGEKFVPCSIYKLHGNMNQKDRAQSFLDFSHTKEGVLLCTDVAARGLDFPCLNSIVQYDPPGEASDYVHRVGRTARLGQKGESVLFLMACELEYLKLLDCHNVTLSHLRVIDVFKTIPFSVQRSKHKRGKHGAGHKAAADPEIHEGALWIQNKLEGTVASKAKLQQLAVDAFTSFVRAYAVQKGTLSRIFHVKNLHLGHIAKSFALKAQPHTVGTIFHRKELKRKHEEKVMVKRKKQKLRPGRMLE